MANPTTINADEITHFQRDSAHWWDENGPFKPLHALNPLRLDFITRTIRTHHQDRAFDTLNILDVGCGGGLVCEPLARLGARVTGMDADAQAIAAARDHAAQMDLDITYHVGAIEDLEHPKFDVITALEIIEHVAAPDVFVAGLARALKPGGLLILSTLNRTAKSYALGIIAAEYILGWVPKGTHTWHKFVKPSELAHLLAPHGLKPVAASGITYNPLTRDFALTPQTLDVNYLMAFSQA